jgi:tripartite-type tricarboxylate transporter receptor subunit TctC
VTGYKSQAEIFSAAERGEVHGNTAVLPNLTSAKADWWRDKKVRVLLQASETRIAQLPDVPTAVELAAGNKDAHEVLRFWSLKYAMSYPLFMAAGVPSERVKTIRDSFDALMKDPVFLTDAKRLAFDIDPLAGEPMTKLVADIVGAPKSLTDRVQQLMQPPSARK